MGIEHLVLILAFVTLWLTTIAILQEIIKDTTTTGSKVYAVISTTFCISTIVYVLKGLI